MNFLIRQKKDMPNEWHVAAQGSEETVAEAKMPSSPWTSLPGTLKETKRL
jgi:hypothetical protein